MMKLVALCMSAEVVMVVEYKNACIGTDLLSIVVGCCKAAHTCADNNEIVMLVQGQVIVGFLPLPGQGMSNLIRTLVTATHAVQGGRIGSVTRRFHGGLHDR